MCIWQAQACRVNLCSARWWARRVLNRESQHTGDTLVYEHASFARSFAIRNLINWEFYYVHVWRMEDNFTMFISFSCTCFQFPESEPFHGQNATQVIKDEESPHRIVRDKIL